MRPVISLRSSQGRFLPGTHWRPHRIFREREYLQREYVEGRRSAGDIAREHGVKKEAIYHWLRKHGIKGRSTSEAMLARFGTERPITDEESAEYQRLLRLAFSWKYKNPQIRKKRNHYRVTRRKLCPKYRAKELAASAKWARRHPEYSRRKHKEYRRLDPTRYKNYDQKRKSQRAVYARSRRRTDINFRIRCNLAGRIVAVLKGTNKSASTLTLLGCSVDSFKLYLESKFESGMSWENYGRGEGKWNIDHIMPCAIFDLTKPEHQRRCFHFSNMQPMWATENLSKNGRPVTDQFQLL